MLQKKYIIAAPVLALSTLLVSCGNQDEKVENMKETSSTGSVDSAKSKTNEITIDTDNLFNTSTITSEQQKIQNDILNSQKDIVGSEKEPLTPNGFSDLTVNPSILMGDISVSVNDVVLLTIKVKAPGTLEVLGMLVSDVKNEGLASVAIPMNKPGTFEVNFKPSTGKTVSLGKITVK
ncbi:MAG: hypothetical protein ACKOW9_06180 [Candidatus Paceibacterota bacterium]